MSDHRPNANSKTDPLGAQIPTVTLDDAAAEQHIALLTKALRAARLNAHYPAARELGAHIAAMAPSVRRGLYDELEVDRRTGLPTYREFTRVQTDVQIAADQLHQLGSRAVLAQKAANARNDIWAKQLDKHDYYSEIVDTTLHPLSEMRTALRRIDRDAQRASFHVELDKLDAMGVFVRYSIDIEQFRSADGLSFDVDQRDIAQQSTSFESLIYKFTSLDSEFTFVKLATIGGLAPERITKGVVGPVWTRFVPPPDALKPIVDVGGFVASFSLDTAAIDVADQRNNDPFATLAADRLTEDARAAYQQVQARSGYRVFKDRKFVVPRAQVAQTRAILADLGTKNIVYGI